MSIQESLFPAVSSSVLLGYPRETRQQIQNIAELLSPHFLVEFDSRSKEIKYCHRQSGLNNQGIYFNLTYYQLTQAYNDWFKYWQKGSISNETNTYGNIFLLPCSGSAQAKLILLPLSSFNFLYFPHDLVLLVLISSVRWQTMQKRGVKRLMVPFCNLGQENELHQNQMKIRAKRGLRCRNSQSRVFVGSKEAFSWED